MLLPHQTKSPIHFYTFFKCAKNILTRAGFEPTPPDLVHVDICNSTGRLPMTIALQYIMGIGPCFAISSVIKMTLIFTLNMPHGGINFHLTWRNVQKNVNTCCDLVIWPWPKSFYSLTLLQTSSIDSSTSDLNQINSVNDIPNLRLVSGGGLWSRDVTSRVAKFGWKQH